MIKLHKFHHQRPIHSVGIIISLMGLLSVAFTAIMHNIPIAMGYNMFSLLQIGPANLSEMNGNIQYYLIACMIFSGLIVDIIGPRIILVIAITISVIANYIFGQSNSSNLLLNCRAVIEFTHIFILIATLTLATHWLPRRHFSLFIGLWTFVLVVVPSFVYPYLQSITTRDALQQATWIINFLGISVMIGILLTEHFTDKTRHRHTIEGLIEPLTYYKIWLIGLVAMLGWIANTFTFAFGGVFVIERFGINPDDVFDIMNTASLYFGVGAILMGLLSDFLYKRRYLTAICYCIAAVSFGILICAPSLSASATINLLYTTVFFTSSLIVSYRKANDFCTIGNSGITLGLILSISTIGNIFFAPMMAHLLKAYANSELAASVIDWQLPLLVVPVLLLLGACIDALIQQPLPRSTILVPIIKKKNIHHVTNKTDSSS